MKPIFLIALIIYFLVSTILQALTLDKTNAIFDHLQGKKPAADSVVTIHGAKIPV